MKDPNRSPNVLIADVGNVYKHFTEFDKDSSFSDNAAVDARSSLVSYFAGLPFSRNKNMVLKIQTGWIAMFIPDILCLMNDGGASKTDTVDGRNPKQPPGMHKTL